MTQSDIGIVEKLLTNAEAEAAFIAFVEIFDDLGCCPGATVTTKHDEGVSFSAHFSTGRARKLIEAANTRDPIITEMVEALEAADKRLCELTPRFPPDLGPDVRDADEIEKTRVAVIQIRTILAKVRGK